MKHTDYLVIIKKYNQLLHQENLLFWNLWCLEYVFEKIKYQEFIYYENIEKVYRLLWDYNDGLINNLDNVFKKQCVVNILNFDNDDFEILDESNIEERAIQEIIVGLESILLNLKEYGRVIFNAYENPINVVDIEIDGILIDSNNTDPTYLNLVKSQFVLLEDLIANRPNYRFINRSIYRK